MHAVLSLALGLVPDEVSPSKKIYENFHLNIDGLLNSIVLLMSVLVARFGTADARFRAIRIEAAAHFGTQRRYMTAEWVFAK